MDNQTRIISELTQNWCSVSSCVAWGYTLIYGVCIKPYYDSSVLKCILFIVVGHYLGVRISYWLWEYYISHKDEVEKNKTRLDKKANKRILKSHVIKVLL